MIRNAIKKVGIEEVTNNATDLIRDTVLNKPVDGLKRTGRSFEENGMRVYDVEVLNVIINNPSINSMLVQNQHQIVSKSLESVQKTKLLEVTKATTEAEKQILDLTSSISLKKLEITDQENGKRTEIENKTLEAKKNQQAVLDTIQKAELSRREADSRLVQDIEIKNRESLTKEFVAKLQAIEPDLIAAINNASRMALMQELVSNLPQATGGLGFLLGKGGMDAIGAMIKGNPVLEGAMSDLIKTESNGKIK
jgi:major vault protein